MQALFSVDWAELFIPTHSIAEMVVRGTLMYLALLLILRFAMLRQTSSIGLADILVVVVIADAAQNGFAKEYKSVVEGIVLVLTIVLWDVTINAASYRFKLVEKLVAPSPLPLIQDGKMLRRNMRREFITEDELKSTLRLQGIDDLSKVKRACLEPSGEISAFKFDGGSTGGKASRHPELP